MPIFWVSKSITAPFLKKITARGQELLHIYQLTKELSHDLSDAEQLLQLSEIDPVPYLQVFGCGLYLLGV
jgi:hypothetical protein